MDITVSIPDDTLANVIFSGLSSIGHWCDKYAIRGRKKGKTSGDLSAPTWERYFRPLQDGSLMVREADSRTEHAINQASIRLALSIIGEKYPHHLRNIMFGETDGETGDVLIQVAAFGDIVYG